MKKPLISIIRPLFELSLNTTASICETGRLLGIKILDQNRWEQVSTIYKVKEALANTTNCLESINCYGNDVTPRRNSYWPSMCCLVDMIKVFYPHACSP
jgi:hypothetical protein